MKSLLAIAWNSFRELLRQPLFLALSKPVCRGHVDPLTFPVVDRTAHRRTPTDTKAGLRGGVCVVAASASLNLKTRDPAELK